MSAVDEELGLPVLLLYNLRSVIRIQNRHAAAADAAATVHATLE